ncbi:hypothetical protein F441_20488 [Phytophthora nicotianae CJ01A1]|nr:hypothetical protein L916_19907 [Phytophthora nicotianae]ETL26427.1 hypothetical protein L916_19906 [Phytophthora nicotianae]ETL79615.1 hypothetical protein L917_19771 [Phytophthora nicotianae]ETP02419.1 hypothetical protein F441_20488 [Phytophthora nicotianae CJ01A1]
MLYKPHTSMELGDVVLGQITCALVFVFGYMIPAVHNIVSWETDLSPIVPEWAGDVRSTSNNKMLASQPHAHLE